MGRALLGPAASGAAGSPRLPHSEAAADGLTRFTSYSNDERLHGELGWHTPAERYNNTPFTARGFERVPALEHLHGPAR